jgi:hypothetical protein
MLLSVLGGAGVGMILEWMGAPLNVAATICFLLIGAIETTRAWRYAQPSRKKRQAIDPPLPTRRSLVLLPVSAVVFLVVAFIPLAEAAVLGRRLEQSATNPDDPRNINAAKQVLAYATAANVRLPRKTVEDTGKTFMEAAQHDSGVWKGALAFVDYRSFLNAQMAPSTPDLVSGNNPEFMVEINAVLNAPGARLLTAYPKNSEMLPGSQSALFLEIGLEGKVVRAPKELVVDGTGSNIFLDGFHLRNVTVRGAKITYKGGPLILENVYFLNCTFDVQRTPQGQQFADAMLTHVPVSFSRSTQS